MTATMNSTELTLQKRGNCCWTAQSKIIKITLIYILVILLCVGTTVGVYIATRPNIVDHPEFEAGAIEGTPEVGEAYAYSTLTVTDNYLIKVCGVPLITGNQLHLNITNPKGNYVWFRVEVLNSEGELIGKTGVIKTNEYVPTIELSKTLNENSKVTVRIIGYTPHTWHSAGNVNLQIKSFKFGQ